MELHEKLKAYMEKEGLRQRQLAQKIGVTQPTVYRILKGNWDQIEKVEKVIGVLGGKIEYHPGRGPDYAFVKRVNAKPSAGGGSLETMGEEEDKLAFKRSWLSSKTTSSVQNLSVMEVWGDSMLPTLHNSDSILIDEGDAGKELSDGRIYVIRVYEEIFVKRFRSVIGKLMFLSDNREYSYQDIEIKKGDENGFGVIGRALWAAREI